MNPTEITTIANNVLSMAEVLGNAAGLKGITGGIAIARNVLSLADGVIPLLHGPSAEKLRQARAALHATIEAHADSTAASLEG